MQLSTPRCSYTAQLRRYTDKLLVDKIDKLLMIKNYHILLLSWHKVPLSIKHIFIISYNHWHKTATIYCYYLDG